MATKKNVPAKKPAPVKPAGKAKAAPAKKPAPVKAVIAKVAPAKKPAAKKKPAPKSLLTKIGEALEPIPGAVAKLPGKIKRKLS